MFTRKAFAIMGTGVLGAGLLGGVAFAATAPVADGALAFAPASTPFVAEEPQRDGAVRLLRVLKGLVDKGVITQQQAAAIVEALRASAGDGDHQGARRFFFNAMKASVEYIGLPAEAVKGQLGAGKTLGQIADQRPGKNRDGLIAYLHAKAEEAIAKALADGKITEEQAATLRERAGTAIVRLVDHTFDRKRS